MAKSINVGVGLQLWIYAINYVDNKNSLVRQFIRLIILAVAGGSQNYKCRRESSSFFTLSDWVRLKWRQQAGENLATHGALTISMVVTMQFWESTTDALDPKLALVALDLVSESLCRTHFVSVWTDKRDLWLLSDSSAMYMPLFNSNWGTRVHMRLMLACAMKAETAVS